MEQTASLILSLLATGPLSLQDAARLYESAGSACAVLEQRSDIRQIVPEASDKLVEVMQRDLSAYEKRVEEEQQWCEKNSVRILTIADADYPERLRSCHDAPLVLFSRGRADLNAPHIIDIVGTRKCTPYGQDFIATMVKDLTALCPDIMIVSGLAYGIDITAHRAALQNNIPTIGVVAHGQDTLYPQLHRNEANRMVLGNGAVLTEYFRGTRPEARNFLQRNRIIAGLSDATIVVESAGHGGGLVTARISQDYGRDVFALPGNITSPVSEGCNNLIRDNKAQLITSASDLICCMGWKDASKLAKARSAGIERQMFVDLSPTEQQLVDALKNGDLQLNVIAMNTSLPISVVTATLFSLEMKGVVKSLSGNTYHLINN